MRIHRTTHPRAFTTFGNALLRDDSISWCAVGLLTYLISLPDGAKASIRKLAEKRKEGRDRIGAALHELEEARYLRRLVRRDGKGQLRTEYEVFDTPYDPDAPAPEPPAPGPAPGPAPAPAPESGGNPALGGPGHAAPGPLPKGERTREEEPPSRAAALLTSLGRTEPRLAMGAAEAAPLRALVEEWWAAGATDAVIREALTSGLPARVHAPAALVADRLRRKKPAPRPAAALEGAECDRCRRPVQPGEPCFQCHPAPAARASFREAAARRGAGLRELVRGRR
ncbi:hypothetical protein ACIRNI_05380 [Streptomyces sp. NPDC093546]|uniref:hypothetical protein n=1 Tax=Streptomyces sp. NPDC093546 TaxID=3366040 RepID=UPI0038092EA4